MDAALNGEPVTRNSNNGSSEIAEDEEPLAFIEMRCPKQTKAAFVKHARDRRMKLEDFMIQAGIEKMERERND
jgi:hypothetical protein